MIWSHASGHGSFLQMGGVTSALRYLPFLYVQMQKRACASIVFTQLFNILRYYFLQENSFNFELCTK